MVGASTMPVVVTGHHVAADQNAQACEQSQQQDLDMHHKRGPAMMHDLGLATNVAMRTRLCISAAEGGARGADSNATYYVYSTLKEASNLLRKGSQQIWHACCQCSCTGLPSSSQEDK